MWAEKGNLHFYPCVISYLVLCHKLRYVGEVTQQEELVQSNRIDTVIDCNLYGCLVWARTPEQDGSDVRYLGEAEERQKSVRLGERSSADK